MNAEDAAIPQETLDKILARALGKALDPKDQQPFSVHRIICHSALVSDLPGSLSTIVSVYDEIVKRHAELGSLVSTRSVGPFMVRLVCKREGANDVWQIVETSTRGEGVVILTYGGNHAREVATRYATVATEVDLASDLHPAAHYFGECRLPRTPRGAP